MPDGSAGEVSNLAGTGARAFGGDEGPGNQARLDLPSSVVVDSSGNIIISDQANYRLRLLEPNGIIHTIAGTGTPGGAGDGGPATAAQLNGPKGQSAPPASRIAIDSRNRIYIADTGNHKIRLIDELEQHHHHRRHRHAGLQRRRRAGAERAARHAERRRRRGQRHAVHRRHAATTSCASSCRTARSTPSPAPASAASAATAGRRKAAKLDRPYGIELARERQRLHRRHAQPAHPRSHRRRPAAAADARSRRRRRRSSRAPTRSGSICTYAGTGGTGFSGDGQDRLAVDALLAVRHRVHPLRPPPVPRLEQPPGARDPARRDDPSRSSAPTSSATARRT